MREGFMMITKYFFEGVSGGEEGGFSPPRSQFYLFSPIITAPGHRFCYSTKKVSLYLFICAFP
jgi:hypothetical protein